MGLTGWASGPLVGFDLETTGLDRERDEPVSYAFVEYAGGARRAVDEGFLVPARTISRGAVGVHGLTAERLGALGAAPLEDGVRHVAARLVALSREGVPVVGCNLAYDLTMVDRVLSRFASPTSLFASGWDGPALDVLVLDRGLDEDFQARPVRRLDALCELYGLAAPTHTAVSDAEAAVGVLLAQASRFDGLAQSDLAALQARQSAWHARWCDGYARRRRERGQVVHHRDDAAWPYSERLTLF